MMLMFSMLLYKFKKVCSVIRNNHNNYSYKNSNDSYIRMYIATSYIRVCIIKFGETFACYFVIVSAWTSTYVATIYVAEKFQWLKVFVNHKFLSLNIFQLAAES